MDTTPQPGLRIPRRLRVEDIVLFLWLVFRPLVVPDSQRSHALPGYDPLGGIFDLVALCLAAACIGARRSDSTHSGLIQNQDVAWTVGPLFGAVAFALQDCAKRLGLSGGAEPIPLVLAVGATIAARLWLPPTNTLQRRALVTPFTLAASGFFNDFLSGFTGIFDLRQFGAAVSGGESLAGTLFVFGIGVLGILIFYLMLVFAPRQIAEREGTPGSWAVRFVVFLVALSLGATLSGIVHGG